MKTLDLYSIGEFADATLLTQKALRHYHERGLLLPFRIDEENGYRWYTADQIPTARLIGLLRSADVSLSTIGEVLEQPSDAARERVLVRLLEHQAARQASAEALIHQAIDRMKPPIPSDVVSGYEPSQWVLSIMLNLTPEDLDVRVPPTIRHLTDIAGRQERHVTTSPFGIFHRPVNESSQGPLEVCLPIDGYCASLEDESIRCYRIPGDWYATHRVSGPDSEFPRILVAYDKIAAWIESRGFAFNGPPREIWHDRTGRSASPMTVAWPYVERTTI